jgi:hypothetical protein
MAQVTAMAHDGMGDTLGSGLSVAFIVGQHAAQQVLGGTP